MSNFDTVFPPVPIPLEIAGETLTLTPIRVGEIPVLLAATGPLAQHLAAGNPDWLALLADHGAALISVISVAARRPTDWVERLELDDAIRLAAALYEVNADFFVQRVAPAMQEATVRINVARQGIASDAPLTGRLPSTA